MSHAPDLAAAASRDNTRAALTMTLAMAGFAVEDIFLKRAAVAMPPGQIIVINGLIGGLIFAALARIRGENAFSRDAFRGLALWRNLSEGSSTLLYMLTLALAPLSFASAMLQATPLLVTAGAALFLGEIVGWRRWTSICVGFVGVLIILEPWRDGITLAGFAMVFSVIALAARDLVTRRMPARHGSMTISAWGFLSLVPAGLILMALRGEGFIIPDADRMIDLGGSLVFGILGYYAIVAAMRMGEVSVVAPFRYSRLVFAVTLAIIFLDEKLTPGIIIGSIIVVTSGLYVFARERQRKATLPQRAKAR